MREPLAEAAADLKAVAPLSRPGWETGVPSKPACGLLGWETGCSAGVLARTFPASSANSACSAAVTPHFQLQLGIVLSPELVS